MHGGLSILWANEAFARGGRTATGAIQWINSQVREILENTCIPHGDLINGMNAIAEGRWFTAPHRAALINKPIILYQGSQTHPTAGPLWYRGYSELGISIMNPDGSIPSVFVQYYGASNLPLIPEEHPPFCLSPSWDTCDRIINIFTGTPYCQWSNGRCNARAEVSMTPEEELRTVLNLFAADRMILGHTIVEGIKERYGCRLFLIDVGMSSAYNNARPQTLLLSDAAAYTATSISPPLLIGERVQIDLTNLRVVCNGIGGSPIRFQPSLELPPVVGYPRLIQVNQLKAKLRRSSRG